MHQSSSIAAVWSQSVQMTGVAISQSWKIPWGDTLSTDINDASAWRINMFLLTLLMTVIHTDSPHCTKQSKSLSGVVQGLIMQSLCHTCNQSHVIRDDVFIVLLSNILNQQWTLRLRSCNCSRDTEERLFRELITNVSPACKCFWLHHTFGALWSRSSCSELENTIDGHFHLENIFLVTSWLQCALIGVCPMNSASHAVKNGNGKATQGQESALRKSGSCLFDDCVVVKWFCSRDDHFLLQRNRRWFKRWSWCSRDHFERCFQDFKNMAANCLLNFKRFCSEKFERWFEDSMDCFGDNSHLRHGHLRDKKFISYTNHVQHFSMWWAPHIAFLISGVVFGLRGSPPPPFSWHGLRGAETCLWKSANNRPPFPVYCQSAPWNKHTRTWFFFKIQ